MAWFKKRSEEVKEDGRGKNPASLAALAQVNAEKRALRRAEKEELERLRLHAAQTAGANQSTYAPGTSQGGSTPSPYARSAPTGSPLSGASQFFNDMMQYEQWKLQVYEVENKRRNEIEGRLRAEFEKRLADAQEKDDPADPMVEKAGQYLLDVLFSAARGESQAPQPPAEMQAPPSPPPTPTPSPRPAGYTQEMIDGYADELEEKFPRECAQLRDGTLSRDQARVMLRTGGMKEELIEPVIQAVLDVEDGI